MIASPGEKKMFNSFDDVNSVLDELAQRDILEPMVEPIDDPSEEINYWDWAEVVGIVDEVCPDEPFWANSF